MRSLPARRCSAWARGLGALVALAFSSAALAQNDGYVLYLSEYLSGDYYYAPLGDVDGNRTRYIRPRKLNLPASFKNNVELGNADVSYSGRQIVFAARLKSDYDWNIYAGNIDLRHGRIQNLELVVRDVGERDEDPRFSWDGTRIVYKCSGNICVYPDYTSANPIIESRCELWGPSYDQTGVRISFTERCGDSTTDRIAYYDTVKHEIVDVPNNLLGPDRFAYFTGDDGIVYSHVDILSHDSSLWYFRYGAADLLHNRTESDDDPYPDKHDPSHIAFIGWEDGGYNLFMYRSWRGDSVRLSSGTPILAPVLFR